MVEEKCADQEKQYGLSDSTKDILKQKSGEVGERAYLNIQELFSKNGWTIVDGLSWAIENSAKHFNTHGHAEYITSELACRCQVVDSSGSFENLYSILVKLYKYEE